MHAHAGPLARLAVGLVTAAIVIGALCASADAAVTTIGGPGVGDGTFAVAGAVAVDSAGNLYALDPNRGTVQKFTNTGSFVTGTGTANMVAFSQPHGIAVDGSDHVWIADGNNSRIVELDSSLNYVSSLNPGVAVSVAVDGTHVYALVVTDTNQYQVLRYTGTTNDKSKTFTNGSGSGQLAAPDANGAIRDQIAVAPDGTILISDNNNQRVVELDTELNALTTQLTGFTGIPQALAVATAGGATQVYVGDDPWSFGASVRRFGLDGTQLGSLALGSSHGGAAQDSSGNVFVSGGCSGCGVFRIDTTPEPKLSASPDTALTSQLVSFSAAGSNVDLWGIADYSFDLDGSGMFATDSGAAPSADKRFNNEGTFAIGVRVTGTNGRVAEKSLSYTVGASHAAFGGPTAALVGKEITFDASSSIVPNSSILDYAWDVDGSGSYAIDTGTSPVLKHTFDTAGTYAVQLRVTREGGRVDTAEGSIRIDVPPLKPPPGEIGVSINGGDFATNDPNVALSLVWPFGTSSALVSNDGGFGPQGGTASLPLAATVEWKLASTGEERLPKIVYVRFKGGGSDAITYTDDIVLDQRAPSLASASLATPSTVSASKLRPWTIRFKARDDNSGVAGAQVAPKRGRAVTVTFVAHTKRGARALAKKLRLRSAARPARMRVRDAAGNWSRWRKL